MSSEGNDEQHVIHSKIAMSDLVESINESWWFHVWSCSFIVTQMS